MLKEQRKSLALLLDYLQRDLKNDIKRNMIVADEGENPKGLTLGELIDELADYLEEVN